MSDVRTYQILERLRYRLDDKLASCHPDDDDSFDMLMEISTWIEEEMSELELPPGWLNAKFEKDLANHQYDLGQ